VPVREIEGKYGTSGYGNMFAALAGVIRDHFQCSVGEMLLQERRYTSGTTVAITGRLRRPVDDHQETARE
jgi:hypothetical protein